jgi:hypothetical protein
MKPQILARLALVMLISFGYKSTVPEPVKLTCTLTSDKTKYKVGELPSLKVLIHNNTGDDIYLIGSLDGSDVKWRMPYCYYSIQEPTNHPVTSLRCGNMNSLRVQDFRLVKPGEAFNPYQDVDTYGFFTDHRVTDPQTFKTPGVYKIQFHYSTNSSNIAQFMGDRPYRRDKSDSLQVALLLEKVPKVDLTSNEIDVTFER